MRWEKSKWKPLTMTRATTEIFLMELCSNFYVEFSLRISQALAHAC